MQQVNSFDDLLGIQECSICYEQTIAPMFPYCTCKLTLCEQCLQKWNSSTHPRLLCPICRREYGTQDTRQIIVVVHHHQPITQCTVTRKVVISILCAILALLFFSATVWELTHES